MFFFQWDHEDWKQSLVVLSYVGIGIVGIGYVLLYSAGLRAFLSGLADVGGTLFLLALVTEGAVWTMVMALGKIKQARDKGRQEGRAEEYAAMMQVLRDAGLSEPDIQRVQDQRRAGDNGSRQRPRSFALSETVRGCRENLLPRVCLGVRFAFSRLSD